LHDVIAELDDKTVDGQAQYKPVRLYAAGNADGLRIARGQGMLGLVKLGLSK